MGKLLAGINMVYQKSGSTMEVDTQTSQSDTDLPGHHTDKATLPQLYLLKLLSGTDARKLQWNRVSMEFFIYS